MNYVISHIIIDDYPYRIQTNNPSILTMNTVEMLIFIATVEKQYA